MDPLVARAPTRIDFGGGWTDVPPYSEERGGCVCNVAIARYASVTVCPQRDAPARPGPGDADEALARAAVRRSGLSGVRIEVRSDYPVGAGLGGSSAAGVALVGALAAWRGAVPDPASLAEESRRLEVEDLGVAGGRQDHYAAAFGGALGLWFGDGTRVRRLPLSTDTAAALDERCIVAYTGQSRISGDTISAVMDACRAGDRRVLAALDRMRALAADMVTSLEAGDLDSLASLVGEHWIHQRALHPAIPTPLIDRLLVVARDAGALGGKALGASGGGSVLAIAAEGRAAAVRDAMAALAMPLDVRVSERGFHLVASGRVPAGEPVPPTR